MSLRPVSDKPFVAAPAWQDAGRERYVEASSMVDDVFRSYRNHNTVARTRSEASRGGIDDLLAELARLTGQGDPYRDGGRDDGSFQSGEDDISPERRQRGRDSVPQEHCKQKKPPSNRHSFRPAVKFNGF